MTASPKIAPTVNVNPPTAEPHKASGQGPKPVDDPANAALMALLKVEADARKAQSQPEMIFLIANELRKLTRARQVFVLRRRSFRSLTVVGVNSLESIDPNAPLVRWIERMTKRLKSEEGLKAEREFALPAYCDKDEEETATYPFREFIWLPLRLSDDTVFGGVLLARETPWRDADKVIARRLTETFSHAWVALIGERRLRTKGRTRKFVVTAALACISIAMLIPVSITALAPAEVIPANPFVVTAPIDGVIDKVFVDPNARVALNQPLIKFVDTTLRNKLSVAEREAVVARSQLKRYTQSAFDDPQAKRELRTAMSRLELKKAESQFARDLLSRTLVRAPNRGVVVFNNKNELAGRPVAVGERIMAIANPKQVRLKIELPVDDAIVLVPNAKVKVYLDSDPLNPLVGQVVSAAHEARKTPSDTMAYELIADFDYRTTHIPRLGVRGTAQVYGQSAPVFLYLFRRPLSALRQKLGL